MRQGAHDRFLYLPGVHDESQRVAGERSVGEDVNQIEVKHSSHHAPHAPSVIDVEGDQLEGERHIEHRRRG